MRFQVQLAFEVADAEDGKAVVQALLDTLEEHHVPASAGPLINPLTVDCTIVHTDGGCDSRRGGLGAWAYTVHFPNGTYDEQVGSLAGTTNNRMEMMAVLRALEALEIGPAIKVVSDSEYVVKGLTQWSRNWVRNGWQTRDGKPVMNRDLWEPLVQLYQLHNVTFDIVKGHSGHEFNERCDALCTAAIVNLHKDMLADQPVPVDSGGPLALEER
ncbi:ribonuclease H family protein [Sinorhizobium fredii]|uniref:ribonuclease H family protein n=1 Tax=Rhizobium fredii TaxID=380 RepID=UPI001296312C|nr:ribonuclease H [Sinorhizobium fredii]MQW94075.1 hypothetical protein [Sinorhizobium fredii]